MPLSGDKGKLSYAYIAPDEPRRAKQG